MPINEERAPRLRQLGARSLSADKRAPGGCVYPIAVSEVPASDSLDLALVLPRTVHLDGDTSLTLIYRTMPQV